MPAVEQAVETRERTAETRRSESAGTTPNSPAGLALAAVLPRRYRPPDGLDAVLARAVAGRSALRPPPGTRRFPAADIADIAGSQPQHPRATAALLQRATRVSPVQLKPSKSSKALLSQTGLYLVNDGVLWARHDATPPRMCKAVETKELGPHGAQFSRYVPDGDFIADCLHTAEEIINGHQLDYDAETVNSRTKTSARAYSQFGVGYERNIAAARKFKALARGANADDNALPSAGQAYVIVETETPGDDDYHYPYHAAGVIATDLDDRITMEMFASNVETSEEERGKETPTFRMYGGGAALTFHTYWGNRFKSPITIVIEPKPTN